MGVHCNITFDQNALGTFFSGSIVTGKVEISLDRPKKVRGISIKFSGYATTSWTETRTHGKGKDQKSETIRFHGHEDYLSLTTYLVGSNSGQTITIDRGIHTYSFACALPYQLPSSFEGKIGHIRYTAKVILDRPLKFNQTHVVGLTVLKLVDLNYESPVLRMPPQVETNKEFYCGPCSSKPLNIRVKLPQTGYVPGQIIDINIDINNASNIDVDGVHLSLRKIVKYVSQFPTLKERIDVTTIGKKITGTILKRTNKNFLENIQIPAIPPTCTNLCKIIQISYEIQTKVKIRGFHQSPRIQIPIVIGNIPLVSVISQQPISSSSLTSRNNDQRENNLPVIDNISFLQHNIRSTDVDILDLPPPTYEEAIFSTPIINMNEDDQHAISRTEYIPRYPVYSFGNRTSMNLSPNNIYNIEQSVGVQNAGYRWSEIPSAPELNIETNSNPTQINKSNRWSEIPALQNTQLNNDHDDINGNSNNNKNLGTWL